LKYTPSAGETEPGKHGGKEKNLFKVVQIQLSRYQPSSVDALFIEHGINLISPNNLARKQQLLFSLLTLSCLVVCLCFGKISLALQHI